MVETSDSAEEELFLTQSSFNGASNRGNESEIFVSSNNRQVDHENDCSALTTRTSIKKSQSAVLKKRLKQTRKRRRGMSWLWMTKSCWPVTVRKSQRTLKKVNFWCLNVWNKWAAERNAVEVKSLFCFVSA